MKHYALIGICALAVLMQAPPTYAQYCGKTGAMAGSYLNAHYGFAMRYEAGWHKLQLGGDESYFYLHCRDTLVVEGTVLDVSHMDLREANNHADSLALTIQHKATLFCGADGVDGSSYCEPALDMRWSKTGSALPLLTFYQTFVREDYLDDTVTRSIVGPYYALDISQRGVTQALLLSSGRHREADTTFAHFLKTIVNTISIVESPLFQGGRSIPIEISPRPRQGMVPRDRPR